MSVKIILALENSRRGKYRNYLLPSSRLTPPIPSCKSREFFPYRNIAMHYLTISLFPHFTHRESPAFVATFLNLFNSTALPHPSSEDPVLDHRPTQRQWRTSHLVSFLGHIALERFECEGADEGEYVRTLVNGKAYEMGGCTDGPEESCKWDTWVDWVEERATRWGDWENVCKVDEE